MKNALTYRLCTPELHFHAAMINKLNVRYVQAFGDPIAQARYDAMRKSAWVHVYDAMGCYNLAVGARADAADAWDCYNNLYGAWIASTRAVMAQHILEGGR